MTYQEFYHSFKKIIPYLITGLTAIGTGIGVYKSQDLENLIESKEPLGVSA